MNVLAHPLSGAVLLLTASNLFMTFAWYAHLKNLSDKAWWIAALASSICMLGAVYFVFRA